MPEPPSSSLITHYLLENPWPVGLVLLGIGVVTAYTALREGSSPRLRLAAVAAGLGAITLTLGGMITTSGEHAQRVVESLVNAVVTEDIVGGMALISDDAVMNSGSIQAPGFNRQAIEGAFNRLAQRYSIESNLIMSMRGYAVGDARAEVHITCRTIVDGFPAVSRWVLDVRRTGDDRQWKVTRLTCISINGDNVPIERAW